MPAPTPPKNFFAGILGDYPNAMAPRTFLSELAAQPENERAKAGGILDGGNAMCPKGILGDRPAPFNAMREYKDKT